MARRGRFDRERFHRIWNESSCVEEAARRAGVTPQCAAVRAHRMRKEGWAMTLAGKRKPLRTPEQIRRLRKYDPDEFVRAWNASETIAEVAKAVRTTHKVVRSRRAALAHKGYKLKDMRGSASGRRRSAAKRLKQIVSLFEAGASIKTVTDRLGVSLVDLRRAVPLSLFVPAMWASGIETDEIAAALEMDEGPIRQEVMDWILDVDKRVWSGFHPEMYD